MNGGRGPEGDAAGDPGKGPPSDDGARVARAVRDAVPTSRHARMFFDMVVDHLGPQAVVETYNDGTRLDLYRRVAAGREEIVPWPLLRLDTQGRIGAVFPPDPPEGPRARPGRAPRLRGLGAADLVLRDGPHHVGVTYATDGRWKETSRSSDSALGGVLPALAVGSDQPVELLARYVADLDIACHGPAHVVRPVPLPGGVPGIWNCGLYALREALFEQRVPSDARWLIADGLAGSVVNWGSTLEDATRAWCREVERTRPARPPPPKSVEIPEEFVRGIEMGEAGFGVEVCLKGLRSDVPIPDAAPENTPAVVVGLGQDSPEPHPWGTWIRLLGKYGRVVHALYRRDAAGFTLVGERLAQVVDLEEIDGRLAGVTHPEVPMPPEVEARQRAAGVLIDSRRTVYRLVDDATHEPVEASFVSGSTGEGFHARDLDGDELEWRVFQQRRLI